MGLGGDGEAEGEVSAGAQELGHGLRGSNVLVRATGTRRLVERTRADRSSAGRGGREELLLLCSATSYGSTKMNSSLPPVSNLS